MFPTSHGFFVHRLTYLIVAWSMDIPVSHVKIQASLIPINSTIVDDLVEHPLLIVEQLFVLNIQDP